MEPILLLFKFVALAWIGAMPIQPSSVQGTVETVYVSNTSVISQTADQIAKEEAAQAVVKKKAVEAEVKKKEEEKKPVSVAVKEGLQLPLKSKSYSFVSDYGPRCAPVAGAGNFHTGDDFAAPLGTPLYAIVDGTITTVVDGVNGGRGGSVAITAQVNGEEVIYHYHHMGNSSQYVKVGDKVKAGDHISDVASTGMSTGPHLHLEVWYGAIYTGKSVDPIPYFSKLGLDLVGNATANLVTPSDYSAACAVPDEKIIPTTEPTAPTTPPTQTAPETKVPVAPPAPVTPPPAPTKPPVIPSAPPVVQPPKETPPPVVAPSQAASPPPETKSAAPAASAIATEVPVS